MAGSVRLSVPALGPSSWSGSAGPSSAGPSSAGPGALWSVELEWLRAARRLYVPSRTSFALLLSSCLFSCPLAPPAPGAGHPQGWSWGQAVPLGGLAFLAFLGAGCWPSRGGPLLGCVEVGLPLCSQGCPRLHPLTATAVLLPLPAGPAQTRSCFVPRQVGFVSP